MSDQRNEHVETIWNLLAPYIASEDLPDLSNDDQADILTAGALPQVWGEVLALEKQLDLQSAEGWTSDWPTEPGWYWFYGYLWPFPARREPGIVLASWERLDLDVVNVSQTPDGLVYTARGEFIYPEEDHRGYFKRIETPVIPAEIAMGGSD